MIAGYFLPQASWNSRNLSSAASAFGAVLDGGRVVTRYAGNRPTSADGIPIAGSTSLEGLFVQFAVQY